MNGNKGTVLGVYFTGSSILLTFNEFSAGFFRNE